MSIFIIEFDLKSRSPVTVENGDVIVDKGYSTVTIRNVQAESYEDAVKKARLKAGAFLDELCIQHGINLEIGNFLTFRPQDSSATRHIKMVRMTISLKGGHRKRVPRILKEVKIIPSDAKTYYRKAEISTDTFDKFRNYFLVIENIASKIAETKKIKKYQDLELIKLSMKECFSSNLQILREHCHVRGLAGKVITTNIVSAFLFKVHRCQLNHSKENEKRKIPFNPNDELDVQSALPLVEFVAKSLISYEDTYL